MSSSRHPDNAHNNPHDNDREFELIDRHLAGILERDEEAQLEELIRTSPAWATRYREAEELARLLHEGVGGYGAPASAQRAIRDRIRAAASVPLRRAFGSRRQLLVAAGVLCALAGAYLFWPKAGTEYLEAVYAAEPLPLADLARSSDVLLIGRAEDVDGSVRFRLDKTVYGDAERHALALPASVAAGQVIALFGSYREGMIEIIDGDRGVVHLDGAQRWEGRIFQPAVSRRRVERSLVLRTQERALADLQRFLASDASLIAIDAVEGLQYSAPITARFLGRFEPHAIRATLMRLIMAREKHPDARNAGAEALVEADPLNTCRMLLANIVKTASVDLHAESEEGFVVLSCLRLMQRRGGADLVENLAKLAARMHCPSLKRAAEAALLAVEGKGPRVPGPRIAPTPIRLIVDGREGVIIPGCQGKADRTLVVFRGQAGLGDLNPLVNLALGRGLCVVVLPRDVMDAPGWLREARSTRLLTEGEVTYLGLGRGSLDAVRAARLQRPGRLLLVGRLAEALEQVPAGLAAHAWPVDGARSASGEVELHPVEDSSLEELLADLGLWKRVLAAD